MVSPHNDDDPHAPGLASMAVWVALGAILMALLLLFSIRCELGPRSSRAYASRTLPPEPMPVVLPPPPMSDEYLPCSDCHEDEPTNRVVRKLEDDHEDLELRHGDLWCLDCHEADDRDRLHRSDGSSVAFEESPRLCVQCHGSKLADWRTGVHGKRSGHWWGPKDVWSCVACHNPHSPLFEPLEPKPPPARPTEIVRSTTSKQEVGDEAP